MKSFHLAGNFSVGADKLVFPARITQGEGTINSIQTGPGRAPFLFSGKYVLKKYGRALLDAFPGIKTITFGGEVWPGELYRVRRTIIESGADCLLAFGGGKVMDLAKLVKKDIPSLRLINIPTSAATCAAMTPVAVMYDKDGAYKDTLDTPVADEVIIDHEIFYDLPMGFFAAGAIDALAKFYETAAARGIESAGCGIFDDAVLNMALSCRQRIIKAVTGGWAKQDRALKRELTGLNVVLAGLISCLGKNTITGLMAHAVAHALTHVSGAKRFLHGEHVSLGLVIQESVFRNRKNLGEIKEMARIMDTPVSFSGVGVKKEDIKTFFEAYSAIDRREKISVYAPEKLMYNKLSVFL
jgi:glycerol dehydrogenase